MPRLFRRKRFLIPAGLFVGWLLAWYALPFAVPLPERLFESPASPLLLDRHGKVIRHLTADDFIRCQPKELADMPRDLIDCTLAAEDKRFYRHGGVDVLAIGRSARDCLMAREVVSGASTITQQLIKITSPKAKRNVSTKLREALAARHLEMSWSKDRILAAYLNRVSYGNRRNGCAEGARGLFQKPLSDLSLGECALLAGIPQAPTRLNPLRNPQQALARRKFVLERYIALQPQASERAQAAMNEPLLLQPLPSAGWLAPWLSARADGAQSLRTTLDLDLQGEMETIVREELAALRSANVQHAAMVVIHNPTRQILALVSSGNWRDPRGGQINGAYAPRSPGSTLKPFTWLLAIERRGKFPGSIVADIPTRFRTQQGLDLPRNYDRTYRGPVSLRRSLACSLNVPALRELNELGGPQPLQKLLESAGFTALDAGEGQWGLGLTIGNAPARLVELTNAYATLANGGEHAPCSYLQGPTPRATRLFSERAAFLIADVLADPAARAPSFPPGGPLDLPFRCAVKTGTSSDFRDNWCIGFTREFTVGVWAGNFDNTPMKGVSGIAGAGPMFHRAMLRMQRDAAPQWFAPPADVVEIAIDGRTGKRVSKDAAGAMREWCPADRLPPLAMGSDYDADGRALLDPEYQEWFASADNLRRNELAMASDRMSEEPLRILAPAENSTYLLDPELPNLGQRLRLSTNLPASAKWSSGTLQIIDGAPEPSVILAPGTHQLTVTDARTGSSREITIHVRKL